MKQVNWVLALALIALSGAAVAQDLGNAKMVTQVPFEFVLGDHIVQPGQWTILSATSDGQTFAIRNSDAKVSFYSNVSRKDASNVASSDSLIFKRYGDRYFLTELRLAGAKQMYHFAESRAEAELQANSVSGTEEILLTSSK